MAHGLLSLKWNNHQSTFVHVLSTVREKESYCDVTLACDGRFYSLHKFVLSTCSEYFEEIFQRTQCKHPVVVLKDINYTELEALLNYMYLGEVSVEQENLSGLIKAAECLRVKGLAAPDEEPYKEETCFIEENKESSLKRSTRQFASRSKRRRYSHDQFDETSQQVTNNEVNSEFNAGVNFHRSSGDQVYEEEDFRNSDKMLEIKEERLCHDINLLEEKSQQQDALPPNAAVHPSSSQHFKEETSFWETAEMAEEAELVEEFNGTGTHTQNMVNCYESPPSDMPPAPPLMNSGPSSSSNTHNTHPTATQNLESRKTYQCSFCAYKTFLFSSYQLHVRTHTGERPYACSHCPYRAAQKGVLQRHLLTHTQEKPFTCPHCPYRSNTKFACTKHILAKHKHSVDSFM